MQSSKTSTIARLALAGVLAAAPVTGAIAQTPTPATQPRQATAQANRGTYTVPVTGQFGAEGTTPSSPLTGTFAIQRFARSQDGIVAVGILSATVADATTGAARTLVTQVAVPVTLSGATPQAASEEADVPDHGPAVSEVMQAQACDVLHLVLGPLDLNLLGLRIQLNQVVLDITAVPGAGNLLGNLLCAITGLLDNNSQVAQLITFLNNLLALLG